VNEQLVQDFTDWNARAVYCYDADGNIVEFIARFNLAGEQGPRPFDKSALWNISELGIVVPDIPGFIQTLQQHLPISTWKEYGPDFKAIGSETGLLITVPPGRNWFPTSIPAATSAATIKIRLPFTAFSYENYHFLPIG
jgi:hypothetical protein